MLGITYNLYFQNFKKIVFIFLELFSTNGKIKQKLRSIPLCLPCPDRYIFSSIIDTEPYQGPLVPMVTHLYHPDTGFTAQLNLCAELPLGSYKCQMTYFHVRQSVWFIEMSNDMFPPYRIIDNSLKVLRMSQCGLLIST